MVAEVSGVSAKAQACATTALVKSRALKLGPGAKISDTVVKKTKCK